MAKFLSQLREDFVGMTDTYLQSALLGSEVIDIMGSWIDDHDKDRVNERLNRYRMNWRFYRSEQWSSKVQNGELKTTINHCRPIVDKQVDWLFGSGLEFTAPPGNEEVADLVERVWEDNKKSLLLWRTGQMASVSGDAFVQVVPTDEDANGVPLPEGEFRIALNLISPRYCHPFYDTVNGGRMIACLIQFPIRVSQAVDPQMRKMPPYALYSMYVTAEKIYEYINRELLPGSPRDNPLGEINIVHLKNGIDGDRWTGVSDVESLTELSELYNSIASDVKSIIDYHEAPTTLIFGARASTLEKGANKVWSNLPKDSRVENLELQSDLTAAVNLMNLIKGHIHEISGVPEKALGGDLAISNTSGIALQTALLPLVERTNRKRVVYGDGLKRINRLILRSAELYLGVAPQGLADETKKYETGIHWVSPLPIDERERLETLQAKIAAGLESRIGALRILYPDNVREKSLEILADQRQDILVKVEEQVAATEGRTPRLGVYSMGSLALSGGLEEAFAAQDDLALEAEMQQRTIRAAETALQQKQEAINSPPAQPTPASAS